MSHVNINKIKSPMKNRRISLRLQYLPVLIQHSTALTLALCCFHMETAIPIGFFNISSLFAIFAERNLVRTLAISAIKARLPKWTTLLQFLDVEFIQHNVSDVHSCFQPWVFPALLISHAIEVARRSANRSVYIARSIIALFQTAILIYKPLLIP